MLGRESEQWVADGLITADQASALRSRYEREGGPQAELRGRTAAVLAVIGATAVGLGVIGFVAANWSGISHGLRLALLTAVVAGAYAGAYHLRERTGSHPRVGEALYLLGLLVFGASLFLVGQMYNVQLSEQEGVWDATFGAGDTKICGRARADAAAGERVGVEYGIETYYASAERAREIERSIGRGNVYVIVDLDEDGSARIERLEAEGSR